MILSEMRDRHDRVRGGPFWIMRQTVIYIAALAIGNRKTAHAAIAARGAAGLHPPSG
jgi:hypothetical protein